MGKLDFKNRWVLVTGASSGLGREMAIVLAKNEKANLIIAARRRENLEHLKKEIEDYYKTRVEVVAVDLSQSEGIDRLFKESIKIGPVFALINNAGLTAFGKSEKVHLETYENIIQVNFVAMMKLNLFFLSHFQKLGEGAILNISSEGAFIPLPYQNAYSATKSALHSFSEGLREEYRNNGILVCTFAPGGIHTEMYTTSGIDKIIPRTSLFMMDVHKVAKKAIRAFKKGKALTIPGFLNKLSHLIMRFFPRKWVVWFLGKVYRPRRRRHFNSEGGKDE